MKFKITIWFQPDKDGNEYELEKITLKTKHTSLEKAKSLAIREAEKCWPHYEIELDGKGE